MVSIDRREENGEMQAKMSKVLILHGMKSVQGLDEHHLNYN